MQRSVITAILVLAGISAAVLGSSSCSREDFAGQREAITVGLESTAVNSLLFLAESRGYFAANGLDVTLKEYPSGLAAADGMLAGEVDLATAAEFVVVGKALAKENVLALATVDRFLHIYLLGRRDRGIESAPDLQGKRIGVPLKTAAEFYLGRFLDLHGMSIQQVTLVGIDPPQAAEALANGDVDAVIAWRPAVNALEDRLGGGLVRWRAQSEQAAYCALLSTGAWAAKHPDLIRRFLKALVEAESYNVARPEEVRAFMQKKLGYDDAYMATVWPEHQPTVTLDQSLVLAMEDEARWMIRNNLTGETKTPDFLKYIYLEGLGAVKPAAVNLIR